MTKQLDKIRAEAAFDAEIYPLYDGKQKDLSSGRRIGAQDENARLNAIVEKLIRTVERLSDGLNNGEDPKYAQAEARAILEGE